MKRDVSLISRLFSVSCVENYFLGWMREKCDIRLLYHGSFVSVGKIAEDMLAADGAFERCRCLPRIQETAERDGWTRHMRLDSPDFGRWTKSGLFLMQVNAEFFRKKIRMPWREDHFIWLTERTEGGFCYLNQYPLERDFLTDAECLAYFGGSCLVYRLVRRPTLCRKTHSRDLDAAIGSGGGTPEIGETTLEKLRDFVGIWKISRKRVKDWLCLLREEGMLSEDSEPEALLGTVIGELEKLFLLSEFVRIRNGGSERLVRRAERAAQSEERLAELLKRSDVHEQAG